ncbi:sll0787 family AIR synthase-like protein [Lichenicoccus sp.]|uniref:sll0787 family AIR synthase-like protein n=1 Tax=Lichenicoccus sp. TaxID=2781899 RepID=UPI003D118493
MSLQALATALRAGIGLLHKQDIAPVVASLGLAENAVRVGDDCAAIPDGDGWLLLAIEGFLPAVIAREPYFAGWCGVMVNLSDIAAMGGRPLAVVDALFARDGEHAVPILHGLRDAGACYGVPIVGGHSNTRAADEQLSVAVLGRARALLTSFDARPGETLLAAIDLRGRYHEPFAWWDASSDCPDAARLRQDLDLLPAIAEAGLSRVAKDISMGGLVGTAIMLAEGSGIGLAIEVDAVPRPDGADLERWLTAFPSFGFLLSCTADNAGPIIARFGQRGIACTAIGHCEAGSRVDLRRHGARATVWDLARSPLTGCVGAA